MPSNNVTQLKIWKIAHDHLRKVSDAFKARGESSKSMTAIASEMILEIPIPTNGNGADAAAKIEKEKS